MATNGVDLQPVNLPPPQTFVGSIPRAKVDSPEYGNVLSAIVKGVETMSNAFDNKDEATAAKTLLQTAAAKADPNFSQAVSQDAVDSAGNAIAKDTGVPLDNNQKAALDHAASTGQRINDAIASDPGSERRLNIMRARELYKLIDKHPEMAKEFRSLLYGDNNFITSLLDQTDKVQAKMALDNHEMIQKAKSTAFGAGYTEVTNMDDGQFVNWYQSSGYARDLNNLDQAQRSANYFKSLHEQGTAISAENTDRLAEQMKPGLYRNAMSGFDGIVNAPNVDEATKMRNIDSLVLNLRANLSDKMPWLSSTEIETRFGDILKTIPDTYRELAGQGPQRKAAEDSLAIYKATADLDAERKYGISTVNSVSQVLRNLGEAGILSKLDMLKNKDGYQNMKPVRDFMDAIISEQAGDNAPAPGLTKRTEQEMADDQEQNNRFVKMMLSGYDRLNPASRSATAQVVVNALTHPDNRRSPVGMDRLMVLMSDPQFKSLAQSPEFKSKVQGQADRAIGTYLQSLDQDVGKALAPLSGHVTLGRDKQGIMTLVVDNTVEPKMRDAAARLQNRLRNAILANANLNDQTPAQASDDFVRTYFTK